VENLRTWRGEIVERRPVSRGGARLAPARITACVRPRPRRSLLRPWRSAASRPSRSWLPISTAQLCSSPTPHRSSPPSSSQALPGSCGSSRHRAEEHGWSTSSPSSSAGSPPHRSPAPRCAEAAAATWSAAPSTLP